MAETADSVVVELEAKLGNYQAQVNQGANAFDQSMKRMQTSASKTEQSVGMAFNNTRIAQMEMQHVITASSDAFAAGIPIQRIFASEMGRIGEAVEFAGGSFGKFGAILRGPWGIALQVGIGLLSALVAAHESATEKAKDTRDSEEKLADALMGRKTATDELLKASRDLEAQQSKALQSSALQIEHEYTLADATMKTAIATREKLKAELELARHEEQQAMQALEHPAAGTRAEAGDLGRVQAVSAAQGRIADLDKQIAEQTDLIATNAKSAAEAMARFARETETHVGRTNVEFDQQRLRMEAGFTTRQSAALASGDRAGAARINAEAQAAEHKLNVERALAVEAARKLDDAEQGKAKNERERAGEITAFQAPVASGFHTTPGGQFGAHRGAGDTGRAHAHGGIDIPVPVGTRVNASAAGVVIESGTMPNFGNVIIVDHGAGTVSVYAHLSSLLARKGQQVAAGEEIGLSGGARGAPGSGDSHGPHLHYEVRQGGMRGASVDPTKGQYRTDPLAVGVDAERLAQQAATAARKAKEDQDAFNQAMDRENDDLLKARGALKVNLDDQLDVQLAEIDAEKKKRDDAVAAAAVSHNWNDKQKQSLLALNELWANQMKHNATVKDAEKVAEESLTSQRGDLENAKTLEEINSRLAQTNAARRDSALKLLDISEREERIALEGIIASQKATDAQKADAQKKLDTLDASHAGQVELINREFASPGQKMLMDLKTQTADLDLEFQKVAVSGLDALNKGIVDAITGAKSLGAAFHDVAGQIISDLLRIAIQETIIKPIAKQLFGDGSSGSGSSIFSSLAHLFGGGGSAAGSGFSWDASGIGSESGLPARAAGGPVVPGKLYRVNETGVEGFMPAGSGTIIPLGQMTRAQGGGTTVIQPIQFDLRGAVMTEDILAQMNSLADQAAMRGAVGGMTLTRREMARAQARRLA